MSAGNCLEEEEDHTYEDDVMDDSDMKAHGMKHSSTVVKEGVEQIQKLTISENT